MIKWQLSIFLNFFIDLLNQLAYLNVLRVDFNTLAEDLQSISELILADESLGHTVIRLNVLRIDLDSLIAVGNALLIITHFKKGVCSVGEVNVIGFLE